MVTALAPRYARTTVRRSELRTLTELVGPAAAGRAATVELTGDPGSGKTALLAALAAEARRAGRVVLRGLGGGTAGQQAPFWPFVEALGTLDGLGPAQRDTPADRAGTALPPAAGLLRRLAQPPEDPDTLAESGGGLTRGCQYFAELRRLLADCAAAAPRGLLLVLDDFHWADPCSVRLLETLIRRPVGTGLVTVVAHRPRQAPVGLRLAVRHGVELGTVDEIGLAPLTLDQSAELLGAAPDTPALRRLHTRSGGNPLYLTALAAADGDPDDLAHLDARRDLETRLLAECAPLTDDERLAAQAAAVLGDTFDVEAVAAVAPLRHGVACRTLGALRHRDLIRSAPGHGALTFRHALLRDFLYAETDACWRAAAHRRALDHLAERGAPPLDLAPHVVRSGTLAAPEDRAVLTAAVKEALPAGRTAPAAQWTASALRLQRAALEQSGRRATAPGPAATADTGPLGRELWLPVVRALAAEGDLTRLRALVREILAAHTRLPAAERAAVVAPLALILAACGLAEEAQALFTPLLAALRGTGPQEAALHVQSQLAWVLAGQLPPRAEVEVLARHTADAGPLTAGGALALRGLSSVFTGDLCAAEGNLDASAHILDGLDPEPPGGAGAEGPDAFAGYLLVLACAESAMGWYGPAQAHVERALAEARLRGDAQLLPTLLNVLAYVEYQAGRMSDALETAREARATALAAGRDHLVTLVDAITAAAWAWLGDTAPRRAPGRPEWTAAGVVPRASVIALLHAEAALAAGDGARALALLMPARDARRVPEPTPILAARVYELLAAACAATGADADEWAERAAAVAATVNVAEQRGHALLARGHALLARSLPDQAARCYDEAYGLLGETAAGMRARDLAHTALLAACAAAPSDADALAGLTLREREVAELAGQGLKTRDIAERLVVSPRTVDVHLTRIYSKLGVNTRAALARLMARAA
ncbi:AAA family ATPase [Streptomyces sp. NPDC014748]|uniref:ATP-binding protein n=1 Tax=Streptomyces sp. NPDC014748 TaxID=3364905 RepID=UPI0036FADE25